MHHSTETSAHLKEVSFRFHTQYHSILESRYGVCGSYYRNEHFRYYYSSWFLSGFCGGFYYPVRHWWEINLYFGYPLIYWMYVDVSTPSVALVDDWFSPAAPACPVTTFQFARVYFPNDTMRDLGMDMSALDSTVQCNFMTAMVQVTRLLQDQVSRMVDASIRFAQYDLVANHYENLGNQGVVLEGFVDRREVQVPFKAILI